MGLEAYLFRIKFNKEVSYSKLNKFLVKYGFKVVSRNGQEHTKYIKFMKKLSIDLTVKRKLSQWRQSCYELFTKKGIIEAHILVQPNKTIVNDFYVRFSVINLPSVIDQTFDFFKALNKKFNMEVQDTEVGNHKWLVKTKLEDRKMTDLIKNIPDEETYEKNMKKDAIPINVKEFKKNKLGIRKRQLVLFDSPRKKPIRCCDTLKRMSKHMIFHLAHLENE